MLDTSNSFSSYKPKQKYVVDNEQPEEDNVDVTFDPNSPRRVYNNAIARENSASRNLSRESDEMRRIKVEQMGDYVNNHAIAQIDSSTASNVISIINAVFITITLAMTFLIVCGLLLGMKTCAVVTNSMEPTIPQGSFVVVQPIDITDIRVNDIISYDKNGTTYIHRVESIDDSNENPNSYILHMVGDNESSSYEGEYIAGWQVQGKYVLGISALGGVLIWIKNNLIVVACMIVTIIIALILIKRIIDNRYYEKMVKDYVVQKNTLTERQEKREIDYRQRCEENEFNKIMNGNKYE